jgi:hypothetical protein
VWYALFSTITLGIFIARYDYFGYWLPNTYYAKSGGEFLPSLLLGLSYYLAFVSAQLPVTPLTGLNIGLATVLGFSLLYRAIRVPTLSLLVLIFVAWSAAAIYDGGDWMPVNRLLVPSIPLLAIIIGCIASRCYDSKWYLRSAPIFLAILQLGYGLSARFLDYGTLHRLHPSNRNVPPVEPFIEHLVHHSHPRDTIALMDIGEIGYRTKLHVIDISGLTEPFVAHSPGGFIEKLYSPSWLLEQKPRWIALRKEYFIDSRILEDKEFQQRYTQVLTVTNPQEMTLYERIP